MTKNLLKPHSDSAPSRAATRSASQSREVPRWVIGLALIAGAVLLALI